MRNTMIDETALTGQLELAVVNFLQYHPAKRVSRNLRNMLLEYLQSKDSGEVQEIQSLLFDLEGIFNLLDIAELEWKDTVE